MLVSPGLESARQAFAAASEEDAFWRDHYEQLVKAHPDQFVAVVKHHGRTDYGAVIAADAELDALISLVRDRGLTVGQVWVRFMAATPRHLALSSGALV